MWGALKRKEPEAVTPPKPGHLIATPATDSDGRSRRRRPNRRRKPARFETLFLEPEPAPMVHARALLELIQKGCPEKIGGYVPTAHLKLTYEQMCAQNDWAPFHWTAIGRQLTKLSPDHKRLKRGGKQYWTYKIPRVCA